MPRPTSLTPDVHAVIVAAVRDGSTRVGAAKLGGVTVRTLYNWLARGDDGLEPYAAFVQDVEAAEGARCKRWLKVVEDAADEDWKAATWLLEHLHPDEFGKSVKTAVQEELKSFLEGLKEKLDAQAWKQVLRVVSAEAATRGGSADLGRGPSEH